MHRTFLASNMYFCGQMHFVFIFCSPGFHWVFWFLLILSRCSFATALGIRFGVDGFMNISDLLVAFFWRFSLLHVRWINALFLLLRFMWITGLNHAETQVPRWSQALPLASQAAWGSQPWVAESQVQKHFLFIVAGFYSALGEAFSVPFTMIDMEPRWLCCVTFVTSGPL